jgi:hypothetical protein
MAIERRVIGPRKVVLVAKQNKLEPSEPDSYLTDNAVDAPNSDLEAYRESFFDPKHLKFFPDKRPTWWHIRPLIKEIKDGLENTSGEDRFKEIVRFGLERVENFQLHHDDGAVSELPALVRATESGHEKLTNASYDSLDLTPTMLVILATMIWHISETSRPLLKSSVSLAGQSDASKQEK